jgi:precorrin-6B methylase 2
MQPVGDAQAMLRQMAPVRRPGTYVFVSGRPDLSAQAIGSFAEDEGLSLILPAAAAQAAGIAGDPMACLTLTVWSSLTAVGLTAAVSAALEAERIPANIVAAFRHDHVFVPAAMADRALAALRACADRAAAPAAGQVWDAERYRADAGFVADLGAEALALLDPRPGERVLDLGCGDGRLTARIGAQVTGLEPDPSMAAAARALGLRVLEQDAHDPFGEAAYDAVFSNAALHWMRDPARVLAHVFRALRPGGRFVAEQGGFGNVAAVQTALNAARAARGLAAVHPWDFPSVPRAVGRLSAAGFTVDSCVLVPRPTPLPGGMAGWLRSFAAPFLAGVADPAGCLAEVEARLAALHDPQAGWIADYVRLRFAARRPG